MTECGGMVSGNAIESPVCERAKERGVSAPEPRAPRMAAGRTGSVRVASRPGSRGARANAAKTELAEECTERTRENAVQPAVESAVQSPARFVLKSVVQSVVQFACEDRQRHTLAIAERRDRASGARRRLHTHSGANHLACDLLSKTEIALPAGRSN